MMENKNLILAIVLSVVILIGFQLVAERLLPQPTSPQPAPGTGEGTTPAPGGTVAPPPAQPGAAAPQVAPPGAPGAPTAASEAAARSRADVLASGPRVRINTPELHGSIALVGGRVDDLTLVNFRETIDPNSPEIVLFSPPGAADPYFAELGWVGAPAGVTLPGPATRWDADGTELVA
ncbi:MAG TPA: membrane protein insertase YidC, partial [Rhodospirillales bacterium]|nr:membrane protein insertase YidC [Rhodospirillales bacterium]